MNQNKIVMHKLKYSRAVIETGRIHADPIAKRLLTRFGSEFIDAERIKAQLLADCDLLVAMTEEFATASTRIAESATAEILARSKRDESVSLIAKLIAAARTQVRANLGDEALRHYKLDERTPHRLESLGSYATQVHALLVKYPRQVEAIFGGTFDTAPLAAKLGQAVEQFQAHLNEVMREERETQKARQRRDKAEERFRTVLVNVAAVLEARLRMADFHGLADRVRPTYARTNGEVDVTPEIANANTTEPASIGNDAGDPPAIGSDAGATVAIGSDAGATVAIGSDAGDTIAIGMDAGDTTADVTPTADASPANEPAQAQSA